MGNANPPAGNDWCQRIDRLLDILMLAGPGAKAALEPVLRRYQRMALWGRLGPEDDPAVAELEAQVREAAGTAIDLM